jgi:hypothetical protein
MFWLSGTYASFLNAFQIFLDPHTLLDIVTSHFRYYSIFENVKKFQNEIPYHRVHD